MTDTPTTTSLAANARQLRQNTELQRESFDRLVGAIAALPSVYRAHMQRILDGLWAIGRWPEEGDAWLPSWRKFVDVRQDYVFCMTSAGRNAGHNDRQIAEDVAQRLDVSVRTVREMIQTLDKDGVLPARNVVRRVKPAAVAQAA